MKQQTKNVLWALGSAVWMSAVLACTAPTVEKHSGSVTQRVVDPNPSAMCIRLDGGPLRCTLDEMVDSVTQSRSHVPRGVRAKCSTDTECMKFGGDGGPAPR